MPNGTNAPIAAFRGRCRSAAATGAALRPGGAIAAQPAIDATIGDTESITGAICSGSAHTTRCAGFRPDRRASPPVRQTGLTGVARHAATAIRASNWGASAVKRTSCAQGAAAAVDTLAFADTALFVKAAQAQGGFGKDCRGHIGQEQQGRKETKEGHVREHWLWNLVGPAPNFDPMESAMEFHTALALLDWQIELGATEAILDAPVDRYALADKAPKPAAPSPAAETTPSVALDPVVEAEKAAKASQSLDALRAAMDGFEHCELKRGARQLVFSDGVPGARVMVIGEAPGRDEDREGRPFVGRAGQLLDKMLGAIDLNRKDTVYITNVLPWRPPQNREPRPEEMAMMKPFLKRHVELVAPSLIILMGNVSCEAMLGKRGITRLRGQWNEVWGLPVIPMFHPAYLLRQGAEKRKAWADLLEVKARLKDIS